MGTQSSVSVRAEKAAKILAVDTLDLMRVLETEGIEDNDCGIEILDSPTTTISDLVSIIAGGQGRVENSTEVNYPLGKFIKDLPAKAAANVLKNSGKVEIPVSEVVSNKVSPDISELAQVLKPIQQWDDKSLLENFISTRSEESIEELDRRARHQKFIVLKDPATKNIKKYEPGKEELDVDTTLKLLKDTRKKTVPGIIPIQNGMAIVYRITELNLDDRIVELCPICGEILYEGYCPKCELNFACVGDDERAYAKLVANCEKFNVKSHPDRKALHASSAKGLDDMRITWPSISPTFDDLKLTNSLPRLRMIKNIPAVQVADPFHVSGNRSY